MVLLMLLVMLAVLLVLVVCHDDLPSVSFLMHLVTGADKKAAPRPRRAAKDMVSLRHDAAASQSLEASLDLP